MQRVIEFTNVSKSFRLGERVTALRDAVPNFLGRLTGKCSSQQDAVFWALKDVSFELQKGRVLGIIGPNGAGKTTILNLLAGIMKPTRGNINIKGRVSVLIALGAGFHPDLTGRENIYLNGAIMGLRKWEIDKKLDSIIEFAELKNFIDTPIKRYSSGMYVRLGFAIAAHVESDIILLDEVLAVGDISFQQKCINHISELRRMGATFLFISHSMGVVQQICDEVIFFAQGKTVFQGAPIDAINKYKAYAREKSGLLTGPLPIGVGTRRGSFEAEIENIELLDANSGKIGDFKTGKPMIIRFKYIAHSKISNPVFGIVIYNQEGLYCCSINTKWDNYIVDSIEGSGAIDLEIPALNLLSGSYFLSVAITEKSGLIFYDLHDKSYQFNVSSDMEDRGILYMPHKWKVIR